jgi:hypothetical protein
MPRSLVLRADCAPIKKRPSETVNDIPGRNSLGTFFAPTGTIANGSLSFLGVIFTSERVARVRITSGNTAPGPTDDGSVEVAAMDDFFYREPRAVPEPAGLTLLGVGALVLGLLSRTRTRRA